MNKKTDILKIDISKLNPYKKEDNLLWSYNQFMFYKKNGHKTIRKSNWQHKRPIQPIIDNLKRRIEEKYGKKKIRLV